MARLLRVDYGVVARVDVGPVVVVVAVGVFFTVVLQEWLFAVRHYCQGSVDTGAICSVACSGELLGNCGMTRKTLTQDLILLLFGILLRLVSLLKKREKGREGVGGERNILIKIKRERGAERGRGHRQRKRERGRQRERQTDKQKDRQRNTRLLMHTMIQQLPTR